MKITFPHLGNAYICVKALLDDLDIDYEMAPYNSKKALEIGTKYAPELACLPLKINIGNLILAREKGADTVIITGGCGPCRFGYYSEMLREILTDAGYSMDIIALEWPDKGFFELVERVKKITGGLNIYRILKAIKQTAIISRQVDDLEALTFKIRPKEIKRGSTDKIYKAFLNKAYKIKGSTEIKKLMREAESELLRIEIERDYRPLKIGIVGEIYTSIDSYANMDISSKLGDLGAEVDRSVTVSDWVIEHIIKGALHLPRDLRYVEAAKPFLGTMIGGHAQETVGHSVMYAKEGYDGVVQIYPLTCMPEIVAESLLQSVEEVHGIPILTLIIDEMTGEAGYQTRLEAFIDLLEKRRERKAVGEKIILPGN